MHTFDEVCVCNLVVANIKNDSEVATQKQLPLCSVGLTVRGETWMNITEVFVLTRQDIKNKFLLICYEM